MNSDLCKKLVADHPALFVLTENPNERIADMPAECRDGWYVLLDDLCRDLDILIRDGAPPVYFWLIKQKYGRLEAHSRGGNDATRARITQAERSSLSTCEFCGEPGELTNSCGLVVVCEIHRSLEAKSIDPATVFRGDRVIHKSRFDEFREKFPAVLGPCAIATPIGWQPLVETLAAKLTYDMENNGTPEIKIREIRPDGESLSISFSGGDERAQGSILMAERLSRHMCRYCGAPSLRVGPDGYPIVCCREFARNHPGHEVPWADEETRYAMLPRHWPAVFHAEPAHLGFGWLHLLEALGKALTEWAKDSDRQPVEIDNVREKYGILWTSHCGADPVAAGMIDFVESFSGRVCQVCGRQGQTVSRGWAITRCDDHLEVRL